MRFLGFCLLLLAPVVATASIGIFTEVQGDTRIQRGEAYLAAAPGVSVDEDDIIETGSNAGAQVDLNDGSLLKLGADSRLLLAGYKFDSSGNIASAGLEMLSGWLRFAVSRLRGNDSSYAINTPTMTIGIRGTEGVIEAHSTRGGLFLEEGEVAVHAADAGSIPLRAGEYIERSASQPFARPGPVSAAYRGRVPSGLQARMVRRAYLLKQRGVPPQQIRHLQRDDRERYLRQHPHLRQKFEQHFHRQAGNNSELREKQRERRQQQQQHYRDQPVRRPRPADAAARQP